jgi:hypothetical protein
MKVELTVQQNAKIFDARGIQNKIDILFIVQVNTESLLVRDEAILAILRIMPFSGHRFCTESVSDLRSLQS